VSGNIDSGKPSSTARKLSIILHRIHGIGITLYNGELPSSVSDHDLVLWMPNIINSKPKNRPVKDSGSVMIISKVMRSNRTEADAVSRIFDFHANAVICIYKDRPKQMRFKLIDALGNTWINTRDIHELTKGILSFYEWSKGQVRMSFVGAPASLAIGLDEIELPKEFMDINTYIADKVESSLGARYFGNFSTRCMKLFPSVRHAHGFFLFSPRNADKKRLTSKDFVFVCPPHYLGQRKYSVDAPCQVQLYNQFPHINFMIHGHATISSPHVDIKTTERYYPCGDLREVEEIAKILRTKAVAVNLRNHGFLLATSKIETMKALSKSLTFSVHRILTDVPYDSEADGYQTDGEKRELGFS
jgi:hypothetical protein